MALLDELQAVTDDYIFNRTPEDVYFRDNVLLWKLSKKGKSFNGGLKIQTNLEYGKQHTGAYGPKTEFPVQKKEILTAAFFQYAAYFGISTYDMEDNLLNNGDAAIVNIIQAKLRNMQKSIRDTMAADIWRTRAANLAAAKYADPRPFCGVADLFDQADNPYGEIKPSELVREDGTTSMWKAAAVNGQRTVTESGSPVTKYLIMSFPTMQEIRRAASLGNSDADKPDLYVTTEKLKDAFEATLQMSVVRSDGRLVDAGFDNVLFKGAAIVSDERQTDGYVDGYNTKYLDVIHHSERNFTKPEWKAEIRTPETFTCNTRWMGQLVCTNRLAHVRATNIKVPGFDNLEA